MLRCGKRQQARPTRAEICACCGAASVSKPGRLVQKFVHAAVRQASASQADSCRNLCMLRCGKRQQARPTRAEICACHNNNLQYSLQRLYLHAPCTNPHNTHAANRARRPLFRTRARVDAGAPTRRDRLRRGLRCPARDALHSGALWWMEQVSVGAEPGHGAEILQRLHTHRAAAARPCRSGPRRLGALVPPALVPREFPKRSRAHFVQDRPPWVFFAIVPAPPRDECLVLDQPGDSGVHAPPLWQNHLGLPVCGGAAVCLSKPRNLYLLDV